MAAPVVTLTAEGFITDPARKIDRILTQIFASDASQSNVFRDYVVSPQAIIQQAGQNMDHLEVNLTEAFKRLLGAYFDDASDINFRVKPIDESNPYRLNIEFRSILIQDGTRYNIARLLNTTADGVLVKLMPISYS